MVERYHITKINGQFLRACKNSFRAERLLAYLYAFLYFIFKTARNIHAI